MFILQVLDFIECESGLPVSGVLQPLTSICGVISVISSDFLVAFEKLLLWNDKTTVKNLSVHVEIADNLVSEFNSKPVSQPAGEPTHHEVFLSLSGSQTNLQGKLMLTIIVLHTWIGCIHVAI